MSDVRVAILEVWTLLCPVDIAAAANKESSIITTFLAPFHVVRLRHLTSGTSDIKSRQKTTQNITTQPSTTRRYDSAERRHFRHR